MLAFIGPIWLSTLWGDEFVAVMNFNIFRYVLGLHVNWSINSFAHIWGMRPYDK
jgi:stearoyl-CoA desaturase (delta-9 desaturase)